MKQGETYEESVTDEPKEAPKVLEKLKSFWALALIVVVIIAGVVWASLNKAKGEDEPLPSEEILPTQEVEIVFSYLPEEMEELRTWGYTTEQILEAESIQKPVDVMIEEAKEKIAQIQGELTAGGETKIVDNRLANLVSIILAAEGTDKVVAQVNTEDWSSEILKANVDYAKLPTYGSQLFIKLAIPGYPNCMYAIEPSRWVELKPNGNIVVEYTVVDYNGISYITSIEEVIP